jgi:iron complex outermembrane receptor protein
MDNLPFRCPEIGGQLIQNFTLIDKTVKLGAIDISSDRQRYRSRTAITGARLETATRDIPQAIETVTRQVLDDQQVYRLSETFRNVSGVNDAGGWNSIIIRGFELNYRNYLVNGQRGYLYSEDYSPALPNVESIEVLKGPSSVLFGDGGLGGIVNIITKKPLETAHYSINALYGSWNTLRVQADATGPLTEDKTLLYRFNIGFENGNSFIDRFQTTNITIAPVLTWRPSAQTSLTAEFTYLFDNRTINYLPGIPVINGNPLAAPTNLAAWGADANFNARNIQAQVAFKHGFNENLTLNVLLNYSNINTSAIAYGLYAARPDNLGNITLVRQVFDMLAPAYVANVFVNGKFETGAVKHSVVAGVDGNIYNGDYPKGFQYQTVPQRFNINNPQYPPIDVSRLTNDQYETFNTFNRTTTYGVYVQDLVEITEQFKLLAALRWDNYSFLFFDDYGSNGEFRDTSTINNVIIPRIGLVYQPAEWLSLYAGYSQGFSPQSSNNSAAGGPFPPERGNQIEVGAKGDFFDGQLGASIAVYQITKQNVLTSDPNDTAGIRRLATGEARSQGAEFTLTGNLTDNWNVSANLALNETIVTQSTIAEEIGRIFGNAPAAQGSIWTTYRLDDGVLKGLRIGGGYRFVGERVPRAGSSVNLPAYTLFNALISYPIERFTISVNVDNITDQRYIIGGFSNTYVYPGAPRNFRINLGYTF